MIRIALIAVLVAGCCPRRQTIRVQTIERSCIDQPPPQPEPIELAGTEEGCPEGFEFCASAEAAGAIERYLRAAERWMRQTQLACGLQGNGENNENENN